MISDQKKFTRFNNIIESIGYFQLHVFTTSVSYYVNDDMDTLDKIEYKWSKFWCFSVFGILILVLFLSIKHYTVFEYALLSWKANVNDCPDKLCLLWLWKNRIFDTHMTGDIPKKGLLEKKYFFWWLFLVHIVWFTICTK